jgi:transcriptional regulator with XRE-family HTH domain
MSRRTTSKTLPRPESLGAWLRQLRLTRGLPLRSVAAATEIDTTLLSKLELGQRLPTAAQTIALAAFFHIPPGDLAAKRIAERFWKENQHEPEAHRAAALIRDSAAAPPRHTT